MAQRGLGDLARGVLRNTSKKRSSGVAKHPNIIDYVEAPWGLGSRLYPVQKVILKAFYGLPLDDTEETITITDFRRQNEQKFTEAGYLKWLYAQNRCNIKDYKPGKPRRELVLACGRRSGKTEMSAFITSYETDKLLSKPNPQKYYGTSQGDEIKICAVATGKDQASELYAKAKSYFKECSRFDAYLANMTGSYTRFQTQYDIESFGRYGSSANPQSSIKITFYSCVAKGLRGAGNMVVILDEFAHFNNGGQNSSQEVFNSVSPSIAMFSPKDPKDKMVPIGPLESKIVMISSPLGKEGFFYEKFRRGWDNPDATLCIQAPSWEVNPSIPADVLEGFFIDNPKNFWREFGAEFSDRTLGWIENVDDLRAVIDPTLKRLGRAPARRPHFIGIDIGVTKGGDGTAIAIGHLDQNQKIVLDYIDWIRAGEGKFADYDRLDFEELADIIVGLSRKFHLTEGLMDRWAGLPMEQHLVKKGLKMIKSVQFSQQETTLMYKNFKDQMWDGRLRLYNYDPDGIPPDEEFCEYLKELLRLKAEVLSRNVIKVEAPRGYHDDRSDALIRMVWLASQKLGNVKYMVGGANSKGNPGGLVFPTKDHRVETRLRAMRGGSHSSRQIKLKKF